MITTNVTNAGARNFFVTAEDPAGPWSEPTFVDVAGIDPDLAWDDDGQLLAPLLPRPRRHRPVPHRRHDRRGARGARADVVRHRPAVPRGTAPLRAGRHLVPAHRRRRDRTPATPSPSPAAPPRPAPGRAARPTRSSATAAPTGRSRTPVTPTSSRRPTGRGGWCCLGVRPKGMNDGFHVLGRETFLVPVDWVDGWPVVAACRAGGRPSATGPGRCRSTERTRRLRRRRPCDPRWIGVRRLPSELASLDEPARVAHPARRRRHPGRRSTPCSSGAGSSTTRAGSGRWSIPVRRPRRA